MKSIRRLWALPALLTVSSMQGFAATAHAATDAFSSAVNYSSSAADAADPTQFGTLKATYSSATEPERQIFRNFDFALSGEQIRKDRAATISLGTSGKLGRFETRLGLLSGMRSAGNQGYFGSEQGIATEFKLTQDERLRLASKIDLRETSFGDYFGFRWKWQNALSYRLGSHLLTLQNIRGPQPLPVEILPLNWDYDYRIKPWTRLAKLLGAGLAWEFPAVSAARLSFMAGYYGGFPGAGLRLISPRLGITLGSWGFDPAENFPIRVWQGLVELRY